MTPTHGEKEVGRKVMVTVVGIRNCSGRGIWRAARNGGEVPGVAVLQAVLQAVLLAVLQVVLQGRGRCLELQCEDKT